MSETRVAAQDCQTMTEVRAGVDSIDRALCRLIGERFRFMEAAARIKPSRDLVRDDARKAEVIANARAYALANGFPPSVAEELWERLVEASIAYELKRFDQR